MTNAGTILVTGATGTVGRNVVAQALEAGTSSRGAGGRTGRPGAGPGPGLGYWATQVAEPEPVTDTVAEITGSPARAFRQWAADHGGDFR